MKKVEPDIKKIEPQNEQIDKPAPKEPLIPVELPTVTAEQLAELKARATKADEHWDRLLRMAADYDNFKKRAAREKQEAIKYAKHALIEKLLPVLDNLEMAIEAAQHGPVNTEDALQAGIGLVYQHFKNALTEAGLEEINAAGLPFDPNWHEAVSQRDTTEAPEGQVIQQLRKGYKLHDRLLRPATVIVARKPGENSR